MLQLKVGCRVAKVPPVGDNKNIFCPQWKFPTCSGRTRQMWPGGAGRWARVLWLVAGPYYPTIPTMLSAPHLWLRGGGAGEAGQLEAAANVRGAARPRLAGPRSEQQQRGRLPDCWLGQWRPLATLSRLHNLCVTSSSPLPCVIIHRDIAIHSTFWFCCLWKVIVYMWWQLSCDPWHRDNRDSDSGSLSRDFSPNSLPILDMNNLHCTAVWLKRFM